MSFWRSILGRSTPKTADLDTLFAVPGAALTLQSALGLTPTGDGAVCYRAAAGAGFAETQEEIGRLLSVADGAPEVQVSVDGFGFTWLVLDRLPFDPREDDLSGLCTALHGVNLTLQDAGYGTGLLCTLVPFIGAGGARVGLVYLYKQGTYYPFAPTGARERDQLLEIQVRDALAGELPVEQDRQRWLALWDAPRL